MSSSSYNTRFVKKPRAKTALNESQLAVDATSLARRFDDAATIDKLDSTMGFDRYESGPAKIGWLVNLHSTTLSSEDVPGGLAGVDYYFLDDEGGSFKATMQFDPYFLISYTEGHETDLDEYLKRTLESTLKRVSRVSKQDLQQPHHLVGARRGLLMLEFHNVSDLLTARRLLMPIVTRNKSRVDTADGYAQVSLSSLMTDLDDTNTSSKTRSRDAADYIVDIYEYDVPYHVRVAIDKDIRVGQWYKVEAGHDSLVLTHMPERIARADPVVMAYDIETTKAPLKFPDAAVDKIMMISYMIDAEGFLITNREIVSKDIDDFEYTPKPEYKGVFTIFNEANERDLIARFFEHIREERPTVIATFNGDFFDWPFVEARAAVHGMDMYQEIGFQKDAEGEYKSSYCAHMDCYRWVKRDSYLPQGSQGLKAVTTSKLGYNPIEVDPELMTPYAIEKPQIMAEYSVSDAVATYYLYMKYVHPFIFSLCNIIPLNPDEVLRKGTGTLCEMLLMVQAYKGGIIFPHKHTDPVERFYEGHLIESETYVGGHVESLEAGVFRSDIPSDFQVDVTAIDELLRDLDAALKFTIEIEANKKLEDVTNFDEVRAEVAAALHDLRSTPKRLEKPSIYHVDVASMYPNIMTTNRLQPDSMISEEDCASCDFNRPGKTCDRRLPWSWRGEFSPAKKDEYLMIKSTLQNEKFPGKYPNSPMREFSDLSVSEQAQHIKKRLTEYSRKVYHKVKQTETVQREAIICQRENPFYVNTVRDFRDRRYEFKTLQKVWKKKVEEVPAGDAGAKEEAKKMVVVYDSLQLAHKVILNSFYGYVMRKGSRWYSMEMAGVTCLTGATIIQLARALVERIGRPLELDTDGIWCILPKSFPEDFTFKLKNGKSIPISYPCVMLNHLVHAKFTNHQYQILEDPDRLQYKTISDNSIFFEVDGPYRAMILPTSKEEDKNLKKRYAVFNHDGSLAELKGFELKRRGELRLIKAFQGQIFSEYLKGETLEECYKEVARVANSWLDILDSKGKTLEDNDLIDMISENRSMSKTLEEYDGQKSTSICTARRLAEFLGSQMVKDKGLACKYIISKKPMGAPVTERAVPVAIFTADQPVKQHYLRKWLKDSSLENFDPRAIIDWEYYWERLASTIQKMVTIPAALQHVTNPVPRIQHPDWLVKRILSKTDKMKQQSLSVMFSKARPMSDATNKVNRLQGEAALASRNEDIEDIGRHALNGPKVGKVVVKRKARPSEQPVDLIAALPPQAPPVDGSYKEFLKYNKLKWAIQKQSRNNRQHLFGDTTRHQGIAGLIMHQAETAYSNTWQLLRLSPSERLGEVRAAVFINGKIQTVRLNVGRKIYVNLHATMAIEKWIPGCEVVKVNSPLPNGHQSDCLYRLTMPEAVYQQELLKADSLLKHPNVEGIYESHVSATDRALLELGTCCTFKNDRPGLLGQGLEKGFQLDWFERKEDRYLSNIKLKYVFLTHIVSQEFQVFAVIPTWAQTATVFVLRPSRSSQGLPSLAKVYADLSRETLPKIIPNAETFEYQTDLQFEESYFDDISKLYKKLGQTLSKLYDENATQTVLCLQSPQAQRLKKLVPPLNDFPSIEVRATSTLIAQLGWQVAVTKRIVKSYLSLTSWLSHFLDMSRFADVPIGNLKSDDTRHLVDILYARRLKQANIILWWSGSPIPDHGGQEKDNVLPLMDSLELPTVNLPGVYNNVGIDLKVRNLQVNAILTAAIINEAEGTDLSRNMVQGDNASIPFVENAFSTPALAVLSNLVKEWWNLAIEKDNSAEDMVNTFISWVSSPSSYLYDYALHYHVQTLSKKAFVQLVREFKKAGSQLVYAGPNRFVLLTPKSVVENTYAYANFLVRSIRSKPLFNFLDIEVEEYWDTLIWMDNVNYGGRACKEITSEATQNFEVVMNWHLSRFLPEILQEEFGEWILMFLEKLYTAHDKFEKENPSGASRHSFGVVSKSQEQVVDDMENYFAKGTLKEIEPLLMTRLKQLFRRYTDGISNADVASQFQYPVLAGSYQELPNPVVQLIKSLCAVFGLSRELDLEAALLRRHLLEVVSVREFSDTAQFRNPSSSLKITNLVCDSCSYVCDLDLCRQDEAAHKEVIGSTTVYSWSCHNCGKDYNRVALEERLILELQKLLTMYNVQDLKCEKCKKIRVDELAPFCECSGKWVETIPRNQVERAVVVNKRVAEFYDLKLVHDMVSLVV